MFVAQQVAGAAEETFSGHWAKRKSGGGRSWEVLRATPRALAFCDVLTPDGQRGFPQTASGGWFNVDRLGF